MRSFIQFFHHDGIRDVIHLDLDIGRLSGLLVLDLVVDQRHKLVLHLVGRNQQFLELDWAVRTFNESENGIYLFDEAA